MTRKQSLDAARLGVGAPAPTRAVLTLSAEGRVLAVDQAACLLLDRSPQDLAGARLVDLVEPDGAQLVWEACRTADGNAFPLLLASRGEAPIAVTASCTALLGLQDLRVLVCERPSAPEVPPAHEAFHRFSREVVVIGDASGRLVYVSPAVSSLFGYTVEHVVACDMWSFVHPDDLERTREDYRVVTSSGGTRTSRLRVLAADGSSRWVESSAINLLDTPVAGIVCSLRDITEQVEADRALRASEAQLRAIAETAEEGIWAIGTDGSTLYANARTATILGLEDGQPCTLAVLRALDPVAASEVSARLAVDRHREPERYELTYCHPRFGTRRLWISSSTLRADDGKLLGSLAMVSDVTDVRRAEQELRATTLRDALTGLPNRALLVDRLDQTLERITEDAALLFLGLDGFRTVNETRGHGVGDQLLVAVSERLVACAPPHHTVARVGGDEFAVVCEQSDLAQAGELAAALLEALAAPFDLPGGRVRTTATVGIALAGLSRGARASADDLLRHADAAMRAAKAEGRGRVRVFDRALAQDVEHRYALAADLSAALSADALSLSYQPVVDVDSGCVLGVEALARWTHPTRGAVSPTSFVAVAEISGLENQLDRWALQRALREVSDLRSAGHLPPDAFVAVNLSARTLTDPDLETDLARWTQDSGLPPSQVVLEITETAVMQDAAVSIALLNRLRRRGFGIAIDDFGTGHSSLAYLRDLPVTTLKIDRSFIGSITASADALAIVASIVDLARAVGVGVVAEGVETAGQVELLRRLGCRTAQGWLWSRATPPADVQRAGWTGSLSQAVCHGADDSASVHARLLALHRSGASLATISAALNAEGFRTPAGTRWSRTSVARAVADAAYPSLDPGTVRGATP